jgi:hypothetical protein
MANYKDILNLKLITNKPCPKCGRLYILEVTKPLRKLKFIMFCECCKNSRNICEVVEEEDIEILNNGQCILNSEVVNEDQDVKICS